MIKNRTDIINYVIDKYNLNNYLEIGVRNTKENFDLIECKNKEGVDPNPMNKVDYEMTSDDFFGKLSKNKKYDIIFVDGLHTKEQVYIDVINSINHLSEKGFIIVHDCNPPTKEHARSYDEYLKTRGEWNGDVYMGFIKLNKDLKNWNCFVVDIDFGCGIITKHDKYNRFLKKNNDLNLNELNWNYFNKNREELLNLVSVENFIN
ncbi:MAG: class I SAM-dependent methyltransferase [archaeon]